MLPVFPPLKLPVAAVSAIGLPENAKEPDGVPAIVPVTDENAAPAAAE